MLGGAVRGADRRNRALMRGWWTLFFLTLAALGGSPLAAEEPFPKVGFPIVDTGIVVEGGASGRSLPIIWMDNDRIIFSALKAGAGPTSQPGAKTREVLIYNTKTGEAKHYADGALLCYAEGRIGYVIERLVWTDPATGSARFASRMMHGTMGDETERRTGTAPFLDRGCTLSSQPLLQVLSRDRNVILLNPEHGYLDQGRGQDYYTNRLTFVRPGKPPIELPMYGFEARMGAVYAHWADTYVLNSEGAAFLPYVRRDPSPKPVIRLLKPDGELIELAPPDAFFKRFGHSGQIRLTRAGMVYTGLDARDHPGKEEGLYLVNGQQVAQLVDGRVEDMSVSPDGCRLALSSARDFNPLKYPRTIKIVQLCG